ncbi:MAG: hypothetical protein E7235_05050 [Lachnospiraceae bacterium]|nr:hypothetical protein [Lachnospiraceae bacterium]
MKYVLAEYASKKENPLKRLLRKTGMYNKYELNDIKIFGTEGYSVTLPFLQEEIEDLDLCIRQTEKVLKYIKKKCGDVEYCLPCELRGIGGRNGMDTSALAACGVFRAITEKMDMKYIKVALIGRDTKAVLTVLDGIYDGLNSLSVLAETDAAIEAKAREVYSETGLDVIFITGLKNPVFMEADIVINCGVDITGSINAIKKGATYITFKPDTYIKEERNDINTISLDEIKTREGVFKAAVVEAVLCAGNYGYRNFVSSRYYKDKAKRAEDALKDVLLIDIC